MNIESIKQCPKYLPADNPARINRDESIITLLAAGNTQRQAAKKAGVSQPTISRLINDEDSRAKLQQVVDMAVIAAPNIEANRITIALTKPGENKHISTKDILTAGEENRKIIGIAGAHTQQNVFIGKYYQQNNSVSLSPDVLKLLISNDVEPPIDIPGYDDTDE